MISWIELKEELELQKSLTAKYRNLLIAAEERIDELESKKTWLEKVVSYGKKYW